MAEFHIDPAALSMLAATPAALHSLLAGAHRDAMQLQQVGAMLQAPLTERMGNTRSFYDV